MSIGLTPVIVFKFSQFVQEQLKVFLNKKKNLTTNYLIPYTKDKHRHLSERSIVQRVNGLKGQYSDGSAFTNVPVVPTE